MTVVEIVLGAVVIGGAWYIDVRWHPWKTCPRCGGDRRNIGSRRGVWGDCRRCGKTGKVRRWGAPREEK